MPQTSYKLVIIGDSGVGKTNLLSRWARNQFSMSTRSTIGVEFMSKSIELDGEQTNVQCWDTCGSDRFRAVIPQYYRGAVGALVVYDITQPETFQNVQLWINELKDYCDKGVEVILIGNKSDLRHKRKISLEEGLEKAKQLDISFMETSALDCTNVQTAFKNLLSRIHNERPKQIPKSNKIGQIFTSSSVIVDEQSGSKNVVGCCATS